MIKRKKNRTPTKERWQGYKQFKEETVPMVSKQMKQLTFTHSNTGRLNHFYS